MLTPYETILEHPLSPQPIPYFASITLRQNPITLRQNISPPTISPQPFPNQGLIEFFQLPYAH